MTKNPFRVHGESNSLWNGELAPIEPEERRTGWGMLAQACAADGCGLPLYLLATGLVADGADREQVLLAILLGSLAMLVIAVANGHAGVRYGIPFAVAARTSFGVVGAKLAVGLRALVGCGWLGIVCWVGAKAVYAMARMATAAFPPWTMWICFAAFLGFSAIRPQWLQKRWIAPALLVGVAAVLLMVGHPHPDAIHAEQGSFLLSLTAVTGLWAWSALGAANLAQGLQMQRHYVAGALVTPFVATLFAVLAVAGRLPGIWNPVELIVASLPAGWACTLLAVLSVALWSSAQNWRGAVVAEITGIAPGTITRPVAGALVYLVAVACGPWGLMASPQHYVAGWLVACSGLLGPVTAVILVEYFALRRQWLNVDDLYQRDGLYEYTDGWNGRAVGALVAGWCAVLCGVWIPALRVLYDGTGITGLAVAGAVYWLLRSGPPDAAQIPPTPLLIPLAGFEGEGASG